MDLNPHALRAIRERSGLSVSGLARRAGISQPHLSNIEWGRRQASPAVARRLADALKVPLLALLADPTDPATAADEEATAEVRGDDPGDEPDRARAPRHRPSRGSVWLSPGRRDGRVAIRVTTLSQRSTHASIRHPVRPPRP